MMDPQHDRFETLGIEPTLDRAVIKRAYFTQLPRHAPHADPEGFRRLRDAYEALMGPGLVAAWAVARIDVERELESLERDLGPSIECANRQRESEDARRAMIAAFESLLRLDLASARARAGLDRK